jgi:hypothetical protein
LTITVVSERRLSAANVWRNAAGEPGHKYWPLKIVSA